MKNQIKKWLSLTVAACVMLLAVPLIAGAEPEDTRIGPNQFVNPGFEDADMSQFKSGGIHSYGFGDVQRVDWGTTAGVPWAASGDWCGYAQVWNDDRAYAVITGFSVEQGKTYELSFKVAGAGNDGSSIVLSADLILSPTGTEWGVGAEAAYLSQQGINNKITVTSNTDSTQVDYHTFSVTFTWEWDDSNCVIWLGVPFSNAENTYPAGGFYYFVDDMYFGESSGEPTGGDNTGGDNTGGDNTGGDNTGGDNTGGDNTGGDNTGGDNTGGDNTGSDNTGGNNQVGSGSTTENGPPETGADDMRLPMILCCAAAGLVILSWSRRRRTAR